MNPSFVGPLCNQDVLNDMSHCPKECGYIQRSDYAEEYRTCGWYPDEDGPSSWDDETKKARMTCLYGICRKEVYKQRLKE